jgi:hypothetical protein
MIFIFFSVERGTQAIFPVNSLSLDAATRALHAGASPFAMDRFLSIPRDALADLLKASGSTLSPEAYLESLAELSQFQKYPGRETAAVWSKNVLLSAVILSILWTCTPFGFCFESVLITVILGVITYFEFRVYRGFRDRKEEAPMLGFRNQSGFALFIFLYGGYHAIFPMQIPAGYRELMEPNIIPLIQYSVIAAYVTVAIVGAISQFCLAWYYRTARVKSAKA